MKTNSNVKKRVLLLGAGLMQIPAMNAVKEKGHTLIVVDVNKNAVAAQRADEFWHIDLRDISALAQKACQQKIDAVFTCATDFTYAVSVIADTCKIPGLCPDTAKNVNYKNHMRNILQAHNVRSPAYCIMDNCVYNNDLYKINCQNVAQKIGYPLVVKPVDNMGARGIQCVQSPEEIISAVENALLHSPSKTLILEKKLDGPELSIDSFVFEGIVYPVGIADRHIYFLPYFIETGHSIPSRLSDKMIQDACQLMQDAARALQIDNAAFKGDIIFHKNKAYIGECAARLSGGYMSGWTIPYAYNMYPAQQALTIALEKKPKKHITKNVKRLKLMSKKVYENKTCFVVERALVSLAGKINKIHVPEHLKKYNAEVPCATDDRGSQQKTLNVSIKNIIITAQAGDIYTFPSNNTQKAGNIIVRAKSFTIANTCASEVLADIYCEIEPNDIADAFLFSDDIADIERYKSWYCYPRLESLYRDKLCMVRAKLFDIKKNIEECIQRAQLGIYIPHDMQREQEIGALTHINIRGVLQHAVKQKKIYCVTSWENSINALALKAILRGGWQAVHYTLQILQKWNHRLNTFLK